MVKHYDIGYKRCFHIFDRYNRTCKFCGMPEKCLNYTFEEKEELTVNHLISKLRNLGEKDGLANTSPN